jgi:hypothetical protein
MRLNSNSVAIMNVNAGQPNSLNIQEPYGHCMTRYFMFLIVHF